MTCHWSLGFALILLNQSSALSKHPVLLCGDLITTLTKSSSPHHPQPSSFALEEAILKAVLLLLLLVVLSSLLIFSVGISLLMFSRRGYCPIWCARDSTFLPWGLQMNLSEQQLLLFLVSCLAPTNIIVLRSEMVPPFRCWYDMPTCSSTH